LLVAVDGHTEYGEFAVAVVEAAIEVLVDAVGKLVAPLAFLVVAPVDDGVGGMADSDCSGRPKPKQNQATGNHECDGF
jgi:hypothetical protein